MIRHDVDILLVVCHIIYRIWYLNKIFNKRSDHDRHRAQPEAAAGPAASAAAARDPPVPGHRRQAPRDGAAVGQGCQHLLVYCLVKSSATTEQHARVWANPRLHLVASLWFSQRPDPFCLWLSSLHWRLLRARVCTKVDGPWGMNLHVALCVTDELLVHHWGAASVLQRDWEFCNTMREGKINELNM